QAPKPVDLVAVEPDVLEAGAVEELETLRLLVGLVEGTVREAQIEVADPACDVVVAPVGEDDRATGTQHSRHLPERLDRMRDVLEHVAGCDHVEAARL